MQLVKRILRIGLGASEQQAQWSGPPQTWRPTALMRAVAVVAALTVALVVSPVHTPEAIASTSDKQLLTEVEIPSTWDCYSRTYNKTDHGCNKEIAPKYKNNKDKDDKFYNFQIFGSGNCSIQNCVHYVAYRVYQEMKARNPNHKESDGFLVKCYNTGGTAKWVKRARDCGLKVNPAQVKAGDILHFENASIAWVGGGSTSTYSGHAAFIDRVETRANGDQRLYISQTGCGTSTYGHTRRYRVDYSVVQATSGVNVISVDYPAMDDRTFSDVPPSHTFYAEIEWAASVGLTTGYADGTFRPTSSVSREAVAAFLYRFAGATSPAPSTERFPDVPKTNKFFKEIEWIAAKGITTGYSDGTFRPKDPVSREALAAFLYRLAGKPAFTPPSKPTFGDVDKGDKFYKEIEWLAAQGIATGWNDGTFRPKNSVTREAIVTMLYRLADLD